MKNFPPCQIFFGKSLDKRIFSCIIAYVASEPIRKGRFPIRMREWRNWQTRTFEGRVVHTVRVQVPFLAPTKKPIHPDGLFCWSDDSGEETVASCAGKLRLLRAKMQLAPRRQSRRGCSTSRFPHRKPGNFPRASCVFRQDMLYCYRCRVIKNSARTGHFPQQRTAKEKLCSDSLSAFFCYSELSSASY